MTSGTFLFILGVSVGCVVAQQQQQQAATTAGTRYVFDMGRNVPALDSEAVIDLMAVAQPGVTFPLNNAVPNTGFDCAAQGTPGYFADPAPPSLCQAFYRCDVQGNQTGFLCPNQTLFNQLTLTCDYYFNVDCAGSRNLYSFANSRLYHADQPLFDTPPKDYVSVLVSGGTNDQSPQAPDVSGPSGRSDNTATTPIAVHSVKPVPVNRPVVIVQVPNVAPTVTRAPALVITEAATSASTDASSPDIIIQDETTTVGVTTQAAADTTTPAASDSGSGSVVSSAGATGQNVGVSSSAQSGTGIAILPVGQTAGKVNVRGPLGIPQGSAARMRDTAQAGVTQSAIVQADSGVTTTAVANTGTSNDAVTVASVTDESTTAAGDTVTVAFGAQGVTVVLPPGANVTVATA